MTSYIPLYRKYRPQTFKDLVGQEILVKTLSNAINNNKLAHAYLLCGPRGTGKTSTARILAKSLNCIEGATTTPCGKCNNCIDLVNGSAIDVIEIDAASNNSVEDARNILEKVQFVPVSGKYKIYIIDEVHMLSNAAFNTLLKTLEEPPENLVFILATTEPHKVLDTIISRCQRFDFRRITTDDIIARLNYIIEKEGYNIEPAAVSLIARKSLGGLRDALALLDQVSVIQSETSAITQDDVLKMIGSISQEALFDITELIASKDTPSIIQEVNKLSENGNEPQIIIKEVINYFRNLMILNSLKTLNDEIKNITLLSDETIKKVHEQSKKFEINEIVQIIEKLSEYELNIKASSNPYLWLEIGLISITNRENIAIISDLEKRIEALEGGAPIQSQQNSTLDIQKIDAPVQKPQKTVDEVIKPKAKAASITTVKEEKEELIFDDNLDDYEDEQEQDVVEASVAEKELPKEINPTTSDIKELWGNLLGNIESNTAKSLFSALSKPIRIDKEHIVISFVKDTLIPKGEKVEALKKASIKLFGVEPKITLGANLEPVKTTTPQASEKKKEQVSQVSTAKQAPKPAVKPQKKEVVENQAEKEEESKEVKAKPPARKVYSDEEANVMNLFNGKILT